MHPRLIEQLNALRLQELRSLGQGRAEARFRHSRYARTSGVDRPQRDPQPPLRVVNGYCPVPAATEGQGSEKPPLDLSARTAEMVASRAKF
jgi:hypothetical protein